MRAYYRAEGQAQIEIFALAPSYSLSLVKQEDNLRVLRLIHTHWL